MPYRDPEKRREYQRDRMRSRRAGDSVSTPCSTRLPPGFRAATAADVLALVAEQVELVRADPKAGTLDKARVVGYLATVMLKAIEAKDLAGRIEELERILRLRKGR